MTSTFFVLLLACLWLCQYSVLAASSNYTNQKTCDDCIAFATEAGWCSNVAKCVPGSLSGPQGKECSGDRWFYGTCRVTVNAAVNIALYLSIGLGIPALIGILWCCYRYRRRESKKAHIQQKNQFNIGLESLQKKYGKYSQNKEDSLLTEKPDRKKSYFG